MSALTHAAWNFRGKRNQATVGSFWLASAWAATLGTPVLIWAWPLVSAINTPILILLALTGLCQAGYLIGLTLAYQRGELSILYPLIRSSPLLILLFGSLMLGTSERIGMGAVAGVVLIVSGCVFLPMHHFRDLRLSHYANTATAFALMAATATAGYSLIDDTATRWIRELPDQSFQAGEIALVYVVMQAWTTTFWISLFLWRKPTWRVPLAGVDARHVEAIKIGLLMMGTYALVVWSMAYARDVSYVAAFRQVSILIGVAMGIGLLKERFSATKILGSAFIFAGLVCVALG